MTQEQMKAIEECLNGLGIVYEICKDNDGQTVVYLCNGNNNNDTEVPNV